MGTYQHVLLAVDFSKEADHVGTRAVALAQEWGARITLLHVVAPVYQEPIYEGVTTLPLDIEAQLLDSARHAIADLAKAGKAPPPRARYRGGDRRKAQKLEQAHLTFGVEGPSYTDEDAFTAQVFATAFGGGMSSRLFQEVREKRGLAYSVHAFVHLFADTGFFGVYAGTGAKECAEIAPVVVGQLEAMASGATEEEAARARAQSKAGLFMGLEGPSNRAEHIAGQLLAYGRVMSAEEIAGKIEAVDAAALRRFATRLLKSRSPSVAALGPVKGLESYDRFAARFG